MQRMHHHGKALEAIRLHIYNVREAREGTGRYDSAYQAILTQDKVKDIQRRENTPADFDPSAYKVIVGYRRADHCRR